MSYNVTDIGNNFLVIDFSPEFYNISYIVFITSLIFVNLYFIIPSFFIYKYRHVNHIQTRSVPLLFLQGIIAIPLCNFWVARIRMFGSIAYHHSIFAYIFGCGPTFYITYLFLPLLLLTFYMRAAHYVLTEELSYSILWKIDNFGINGTGKRRQTMSRKKYRVLEKYARKIFKFMLIRDIYKHHTNSSGQIGSSNYSWTTNLKIFGITEEDAGNKVPIGELNSTKPTSSTSTSQHELPSAMGKVNGTAILRTYCVMLVIEIVAMLIAILPRLNHIDYCDLQPMFMPLYVLVTPSPLFCLLLLFIIRNSRDNFGIKFDLGFAFSAMIIGSVLHFITSYPIWKWGYTYIYGTIFLLLITMLIHFVDVIVPLFRAHRHVRYLRHCHRQKGITNSEEKLTIDKAIDDAMLWEQFQLQIVKDFAGENAEFINDYKKVMEKYQQLLSIQSQQGTGGTNQHNGSPQSQSQSQSPEKQSASTQKKQVTMVLINQMIQNILRNYILPGSPFELNITAKLRSSVVEEVKTKLGEGKNVSPDILDPVFDEVKKILEMNSWLRFLEIRNGEIVYP
ncbi:hypothetical protein BKA69DRAFT_1080783 [Paraphysoderma sedebokerense]|nr:hypothetical protein BKA69DRAFT_1080783 [Paraphysoderma sedebokerense]